MIDKNVMYNIAKGGISDPQLTLTVDGEQMVISGKSCKYFAIGYLVGLKAAKCGISVDDNAEEVKASNAKEQGDGN